MAIRQAVQRLTDGTMKSFGKIAILFGLLGGVMAYFIIPVQFTLARLIANRQGRVRPDCQ
jgi:hypothetical protein